MFTKEENKKNGRLGLCKLADCLGCNEILMTEKYYDCESKSKPDWCPLKPLPEKMTGVASTDHWNSINSGWNGCIDEITGGEADGEINT